MKIAIVHEMLIKLGGAERVLLELLRIYPHADIFTLMYDEQKVGKVFPRNRVWSKTLAQHFFTLTKKPRWSLPLMPFSVSQIDLSEYDLVISSSSGFAHGVRVAPKARHICYCHSPARYLWDATREVQSEIGATLRESDSLFRKIRALLLAPLVKGLFSFLRSWDKKAAKRSKIYIANSHEVQKRIQMYYGASSEILWPPVDTARFRVGPPTSQRKNYVLTSALTPFKQVDRAIRVMTRLSLSLVIIGDGDQRQALQDIAGDTITFLGKITDEEVARVYEGARGFLMPQKEDAGIAPLEAFSAGIPVFGLAKGGLLEVHIDGVTGRFFSDETDESFLEGFLRFHAEVSGGKYDDSVPLVVQAKKYDAHHFSLQFRKIVER